MRTAASPRPLLASVTVPATTPVWAAAVVAASARPIADPANLAKKRVPPGERDVRIFPPEWNAHCPFFRLRRERVKMGASVRARLVTVLLPNNVGMERLDIVTGIPSRCTRHDTGARAVYSQESKGSKLHMGRTLGTK